MSTSSELGRDFDVEPWTPDQPRLTGVAQAAFEVNFLTEDNLPSYHHQLLASFGHDGAWRTWSHRWTAEEGRHAVVLRDYLLVTCNTTHTWNAAAWPPRLTPDKTALGLLAYAAFQELATRISHRNTGRHSDDPVADKIMVRVAAENPHMFYRDIVAAAFRSTPQPRSRRSPRRSSASTCQASASRASPARPCRWPRPHL